VLIVGVLLTAIVGIVETCSETPIATASGIEIVETCATASLLDPRYLLVLVISALLVWPDLSEVTVGSFSVRRRLEHAEDEQRALKGQVERLSQTIQMNQTMNVRLEPSYVDIKALRDESVAAGLPASDDSIPAGRSYPDVAMDIIHKYERLRLFDTRFGTAPDSLEFVGDRRPSREARLWADQVADHWPESVGRGAAMTAEQARVFTSNFPETLDGVRAVRNAIAHGKHVAEDDLEAAASMVQGLEGFLLERFAHWRSLERPDRDIGPRIGSELLGEQGE